MLDLHLIASSRALVTTSASGFYLAAEAALRWQNRTVLHTCTCTPATAGTAGLPRGSKSNPHRNSSLHRRPVQQAAHAGLVRSSKSSLLSGRAALQPSPAAAFSAGLTRYVEPQLPVRQAARLTCSSSATPACSVDPPDALARLRTNTAIYFHGDSTIRQLYGAAASFFTGKPAKTYEQMKEETRVAASAVRYGHVVDGQTCTDQARRQPYVPTIALGSSQCQKNERTCTLALPQTGTRLTWDWKHFVLEEHDAHLYGRGGHFSTAAPPPDVLVTGVGFHLCAHTTPPTAARNDSLMQHMRAQIPALVRMVGRSAGPNTLVFFLTSPGYTWGHSAHDNKLHFDCMERNSQLVRDAVAHSSHPRMHVVEQSHVYQMFGNASGNWGMHRPEWVVDTVWHYIAAAAADLLPPDDRGNR